MFPSLSPLNPAERGKILRMSIFNWMKMGYNKIILFGILFFIISLDCLCINSPLKFCQSFSRKRKYVLTSFSLYRVSFFLSWDSLITKKQWIIRKKVSNKRIFISRGKVKYKVKQKKYIFWKLFIFFFCRLRNCKEIYT